MNKSGQLVWFGNGLTKVRKFDKERDAAIFVDKEFIKQGKRPVNILKKL